MSDLDEDDVRELRRQGDLAELLRQEQLFARERKAARRALVLRHPEVAARLCDPPADCASPEAWSGYVPPELWNGRRNSSPVRTQLAGIVADARVLEDR